ncbi:MAG: type II secretion system F family protein [Brevirhabdus sp.]
MRPFAYVAFTGDGKRRTGSLVAESETHAADILTGKGLFPSEIRQVSDRPRSSRFGLGRTRLSDDARAVFTRQMAVLLGAELPVDAALEAVHSSGGGGAIAQLANHARASVLDGMALSAALARANAGFPRYYIAALRAGESSGEIAAVFEELADFLESAGNDKSQVLTALVYPAFVVAVSLVVSSILVVNVAPQIIDMFEVTGRDLPGLTQTVLGFTDWVQAHWLMLLLAVLTIGVGFALALRLPWFRDRWHGFILSLPVVGRLTRLAASAQYLRTLALVIASRQTVLDATRSAAEVLAIRRFQSEADAVTDAVQSGESLSQALTRLSLISPVAMQLIDAGERSARLGRMTGRAAVMVETWLVNDRKRVAALLDPILMMVVGGFVLVIVLAVLLPIFDLQSAIGG